MRLELRGVRIVRGGRAVLDGVDLDLEPGAIRLLVGSSGAGKTTLLRAVAGLEPLDAGRVALDGELVSQGPELLVPPHRRRLGMSFQDDALWPHLSAHSHLLFGRGRDAAGEARAAELLALVGLAGRGDARPDELSGGERQRLGVARALALEPRLLLLDEPLAHIDLRARRRLARDLVGWLRQRGASALWVTHHPDELAFVEGEASLLEGGKLAGPFSSGELRAQLERD